MNYLVGRETSKLYENTTPVKLAEMLKFTFAKSLRGIRPTEEDTLVRYGIAGNREKDYLFGTVINSGESIIKASNKRMSALILQRRKIPSPKIFLHVEDIRATDLPVVRRLKHHSRGSDIKLVTSLRHIPQGDYYSKFIESNCEYRIHVFDGKAIRVQLKVKGEETVDDDRDFIHNVENGFLLKDTFDHNLNLEKEMIPIAENAVKLLGLDFGAADVLVGKDNKPYILEVNSAPRLCKFGRQLYTIYLYEKLGIKYDLATYARVRLNEGKSGNGLPIKYREILV
jgi:predicted ATP-grasp superfamily ATP-dependent carboligase